ncbi:MAG: 4Fe-4S dicluster domain-containing protein [Chloroflexales bacterium]|nr:4Fe-4S dicluster domain-containing protein [Chloroflexales bacterium]
MGHTVAPPQAYRLLQQRLDRNVTGAPDSPTLMRILQLLFSPVEADLARRIPTTFISLRKLAKRADIAEDRLAEMVVSMAERGLVFDLEHDGRRYVALAPVVIGFFEFTYMRTREGYPNEELAKLFDEYFFEREDFAHAVFAGQTQIGRSLVREEALPQGDHTEVLDWERASVLVETATSHAVSLCACRNHAQQAGHPCEHPQRTCLSLNLGAELLARQGIAEPISRSEAMGILEQAKGAGLAQTGDNVQRNVSYICNCCGCSCGMMNAIRRFDIRNAIVTSNWISLIDPEVCRGCGRCAKICPVDAITINHGEVDGRKRKWAVRDAALCLGCGVGYAACKHGALTMQKRERRVFTPETTFDRIVAMAIERGKLGDMLLDNLEGWGYEALARVVQVIEKTPFPAVVNAIEPLKSTFLSAVVQAARASGGKAASRV